MGGMCDDRMSLRSRCGSPREFFYGIFFTVADRKKTVQMLADDSRSCRRVLMTSVCSKPFPFSDDPDHDLDPGIFDVIFTSGSAALAEVCAVRVLLVNRYLRQQRRLCKGCRSLISVQEVVTEPSFQGPLTFHLG